MATLGPVIRDVHSHLRLIREIERTQEAFRQAEAIHGKLTSVALDLDRHVGKVPRLLSEQIARLPNPLTVADVAATSRLIADIELTHEVVTRVAADISRAVEQIAVTHASVAIAAQGTINHVAETISAIASAFPADDFESLRRLVERAKRAESDDAPTTSVVAIARAFVEGLADVDWKTHSPEARARLIGQLIKLFFALLSLVTTPSLVPAPGSQIASTEFRELQRERTALETIVRGLEEGQRSAARRHRDLRVKKTAIMREEPSGSSGRVRRLPVGIELTLIAVAGRWYFVEIVDEDGNGSGERGWVYRRNVVRATNR